MVYLLLFHSAFGKSSDVPKKHGCRVFTIIAFHCTQTSGNFHTPVFMLNSLFLNELDTLNNQRQNKLVQQLIINTIENQLN